MTTNETERTRADDPGDDDELDLRQPSTDIDLRQTTEPVEEPEAEATEPDDVPEQDEAAAVVELDRDEPPPETFEPDTQVGEAAGADEPDNSRPADETTAIEPIEPIEPEPVAVDSEVGEAELPEADLDDEGTVPEPVVPETERAEPEPVPEADLAEAELAEPEPVVAAATVAESTAILEEATVGDETDEADEPDETDEGPLLTDAEGYRERWSTLQIGFVDEPRQAVEGVDRLLEQVGQDLATIIATRRESLLAQWEMADTSTEDLRRAFQEYRSLFDRLLSI
jgi:hypothetical protein